MNLRPRDRIALVALALLALAGAYYMLALKPERHKIKTLDAAIATQQQAIAQAEQQITTGQAAVASLRASDAQWGSVSLAVPAQADVPGLLRTLQRTSTVAHVSMQSINLAGSSSSTTSSSSSGSTSSAATATPVPLTLSFTGSYRALDGLLDRLEGLVKVSGGEVQATGPLMNVSSIQLSGTSDLTAQVSANIYQLSSSSASTGAATTASGQ